MCAACGLVDDDTEGPRVEKAAPAPQATEASASRAAIQPYAEFVPYPYTFDTDTNTASHVSAAPVVSLPMSDAGAQSYILPVTVPHAATNILGAQPPTNILTAAAPCAAVPPPVLVPSVEVAPASQAAPVVSSVSARPTRTVAVRRRAPLRFVRPVTTTRLQRGTGAEAMVRNDRGIPLGFSPRVLFIGVLLFIFPAALHFSSSNVFTNHLLIDT